MTRREATALSVSLLALALLAPPLLAGAQKDPVTGTITIKVAKEEEEPVAARPRLRVVEIAGPAPAAPAAPAAAQSGGEWAEAYHRPPGAAPSAEAQVTLRVAKDRELGRQGAVNQLKNGGEATRPLIRSLDIGRHDILKWLYARAFALANQELARDKKSPLRKVLTVNSGGTGDYTRDQDITAFGGDEVTELAFFRGLVAAAGEIGLEVDPKKTGGIDFPQIEVTIFPGRNDLPDSRFGTDMGEFQLNYIKGVHKQLGDVEAYIGGGADLEVKGRRRPGQVYAQELTLDDEGGLRYRAEVPGNTREAHRLFDVEPRSRPEAWQKAAHIFNDMLQGYRHSLHGDDPTKGPLKYSGRAIDYLCSIRGKQPWKDLQPDERKVMLESLFPGQKIGEGLLKRLESVIDVADHVIRNKKLPAGCNAESDQKIAMIFLKKAVAASAGEMAKQAINPPPFDEGWLTPAERARWDAMDPAERHEEALKRDRAYRENFSNEAYENLVVTLAMLRRIDLEEGKAGRSFHGEEAIRQMIATADPKVRGVLEDASEYAKLYMELQMAPTPDVREKVRGEVFEARKKLAGHLDDSSAPGTRILDEIEKMGARNYLEADMKGRRAMPGAAAEVKARFDEHMKQAFPTTAEEFRTFTQKLETMKVKGYVIDKLKAEFFQLDTLADGLTLIEMYQKGASKEEFGRFAAINLLSRVHWSFSHLWQASQVKTEADIEALGQNLVFATLARLVPWAATAKIVFDVGKGLVTVTVGYSIDVVNADLVDALYTGAAGKSDDDNDDVGALRSSGFQVLPPHLVLWVENEKTKKKERMIDRPELYRHFFREWTGFEAEDLREFSTRKGSLATAHDEVVHILMRQAANYDRAWVSAAPKKRIERMLSDQEVMDALGAFNQAVERQARLAAGKVGWETAVREYRSIFDSEDVIKKGLADRFAADFQMGFLSYWDSWLTARVLAAREIERTAMQADMAGYAKVIRGAVNDAIVTDEPGIRKLERLDLLVDVHGLRENDGEIWDGSEPVRIAAQVEGLGEVGERNPEIAIRVTPQKVAILQKAGEKEDVVEPGDLIEQTVLVQALADQGRGAELARTEVMLKIRMPKESGETREVAIRRREERREDGSLGESFSYIERVPGLPPEWPTEDGYVFHGTRIVMRFGTAKETIEYAYGVREGLHEVCDGKGRWVIRETMKAGKREGTRVHRDPDSQARLEEDYRADEKVEERSYHENGQLSRRLTYDRTPAESPDDERCKGTVEARWSNGNVRFKGAYDAVGRGSDWISDLGGYGGETVPGRQGEWLWYHENGQRSCSGTFRDGQLHGAYRSWDENGVETSAGNYESGRKTGSWREGRGSGSYLNDLKNGRWEYLDEKGRPDQWEVWSNGNLGDRGFYDKED